MTVIDADNIEHTREYWHDKYCGSNNIMAYRVPFVYNELSCEKKFSDI